MQDFPGGQARGVQKFAPHEKQPVSQKIPEMHGQVHTHTFQRICWVRKHYNTPGNRKEPPPETGTLLTSTLQPPAQGPDHFGTPEPLEAGSQVPVVPLQ